MSRRYGYDYVCNSTAYDPEGRHRDGCLLHIGGPCGNTCVGGNATEGGWCFRNCTSQIGYGEAADLHQWLGDRNITVSNWGVSTDGDGVTPFYEYVSPSDGRRHQVWAGRNPPLATDNLLENTDGVGAPHQCSLGAAPC